MIVTKSSRAITNHGVNLFFGSSELTFKLFNFINPFVSKHNLVSNKIMLTGMLIQVHVYASYNKKIKCCIFYFRVFYVKLLPKKDSILKNNQKNATIETIL